MQTVNLPCFFPAYYDKNFLKFHVQLTPHHAASKKAKRTRFHGKISRTIVT